MHYNMTYYMVVSDNQLLNWESQLSEINEKYSTILFKSHSWILDKRSFIIMDIARTFGSCVDFGDRYFAYQHQPKILTRPYFTRGLNSPTYQRTNQPNIEINLLDNYTLQLPLYDKVYPIITDKLFDQLILFTNNDLLNKSKYRIDPFSMFYFTPRLANNFIVSIDYYNTRYITPYCLKTCFICHSGFGHMVYYANNTPYHAYCLAVSQTGIQCQSNDIYDFKELCFPNGLLIYQSISTKILTIFTPYGTNLTPILPKILNKYHTKVRIITYILLEN